MHGRQVTAAGHANLANQYEDQSLTQESESLEAIANLEVASSLDNKTVNTLTETSVTLVQEIVSLHKELAA